MLNISGQTPTTKFFGVFFFFFFFFCQNITKWSLPKVFSLFSTEIVWPQLRVAALLSTLQSSRPYGNNWLSSMYSFLWLLPSQFLIFSIFLQKRPEILSSSKISFWNNCCCCCYCCCSTLQLCWCDCFPLSRSISGNKCFTWFCQITAHHTGSSD